jgi:hypothetical protein
MIKAQLARKAVNFLKPHTAPHLDELVLHLVLHTASLELIKGEYLELAGVKGMCGTVHLSGNSLPCFKYRVFDKGLMEFIYVTVEVSRPDRIHYISRIESTDPKENGKEVETKDQYKAPFMKLAHHLFEYFPWVTGKKG